MASSGREAALPPHRESRIGTRSPALLCCGQAWLLDGLLTQISFGFAIIAADTGVISERLFSEALSGSFGLIKVVI